MSAPPTSAATTPEAYELARTALQRLEQERSFDAAAIATASPLEKDANTIVHWLRSLDLSSPSRTGSDTNKPRTDHFLGHVTAITSSPLLRIARRMPKGAHLHCHFNSCLPVRFLIRHARGLRTMCVRSSLPLRDEAARRGAEISFAVLPLGTARADVFDADYLAGEWMPYVKFCERFSGGVEGAEEWLEGKMVLKEEEVHDISQTVIGFVVLVLMSSPLP